MKGGGGILGVLTLAVIGVIIADVLIHPQGVKAFGNASNTALKNTYTALLGKAPR
jgi:hypothetical protein